MARGRCLQRINKSIQFGALEEAIVSRDSLVNCMIWDGIVHCRSECSLVFIIVISSIFVVLLKDWFDLKVFNLTWCGAMRVKPLVL